MRRGCRRKTSRHGSVGAPARSGTVCTDWAFCDPAHCCRSQRRWQLYPAKKLARFWPSTIRFTPQLQLMLRRIRDQQDRTEIVNIARTARQKPPAPRGTAYGGCKVGIEQKQR